MFAWLLLIVEASFRKLMTPLSGETWWPLGDYTSIYTTKFSDDNTMDDLVKAALGYADGAVTIAEELLQKWYDTAQDGLDSNCSMQEYECRRRQLRTEYQKYRDKLTSLRHN